MEKKSIKRRACTLGISEDSKTEGGASLDGIFLAASALVGSGVGAVAEEKSSKSLMSTGMELLGGSCALAGEQRTGSRQTKSS